MLNFGQNQNSLVAHAGCGKMAWTETPAEIFRRNCQEKADKIFREKLIADAKKSEEISKKICIKLKY